MEAYEATRVVFTRIQGLDPENAAKIMGLLLIQDNGEKEMIRLAFGPETIVQATVWKARKELGLLGSPTSTTSTGATASLSGAAPYFSRQNSRLLSSTSSSPSLSSSSSSAAATPSGWASAGHHPHNASFRGGMSCNGGDGDEAAARNTTDEMINVNDQAAAPVLSSSGTTGNHATLSESHSPGGHKDRSISNGYLYGGETIDVNLPFPSDHFSFLNDHPFSSSSQSLASANATNHSPAAVSPGDDYGAAAAAGLLYDDRKINNGANNDALLFPYVNWASSAASNHNATASSAALGAGHRRSCSLADLCLTPAEAGLAWKPCMYYARGYCKNGSNCRFLHGFLDAYSVGMSPRACGSPTASASNNRAEMSAGDQTTVSAKVTEAEHRASEFLRFKSQRSPSLPHIIPPSFAYGKCGTHPFLFDGYHLPADSPRQLQQNSLFGGDQDTFCRTPGRMDRNDFVNPGSRQIYLTFPAESTFLEEDVSNYFSIYGPVQDVRIPYQQKRMFGFVTFVFPETVKIILAKGNPHYVCDARVLVKPYKEKGKVAEKKHAERGDFSGCSSLNSFDSREAYEVQLGSAGRIFYNSQEAFKRRLEAEQAELHQAIELGSRRLMNLHLLDVKKSSLMTNRGLCSQNIVPTPSSDGLRDATESVSLDHSATTTPSEQQQQWIGSEIMNQQLLKVVTDAADGRGICDDEENTLQGSLEHNLPDSPFASSIDSSSMISDGIIPGHGFSNNLTSSSSSSLLPATPTLDLTSARSCYFQMHRFSSAHGAIGM